MSPGGADPGSQSLLGAHSQDRVLFIGNVRDLQGMILQLVTMELHDGLSGLLPVGTGDIHHCCLALGVHLLTVLYCTIPSQQTIQYFPWERRWNILDLDFRTPLFFWEPSVQSPGVFLAVQLCPRKFRWPSSPGARRGRHEGVAGFDQELAAVGDLVLCK